MSLNVENNVQVQSVQQGLIVLKKRQRNMMLFGVASFSVFVLSIFALFFQHDVIFAIFGLATQVKQLYFPATMSLDLSHFSSDTDYIFNLFSWIGWLILKFFAGFFGAFILLSILKRFQFFKIRFKSFVLRFVAWLVCFILIWTGLSAVQYDTRDKKEKTYVELTQYDQNIQQSKIAQYLQDSNEDPNIKAYLLAQTALLHQPPDKSSAQAFVQVLIDAEKSNPNFSHYGFKAEQLWTMQQQLYGKSLTPLAQSVHQKVSNAMLLEKIVNFIVWAFLLLSIVTSLILWIISNHLKKRVLRIEQSI